MTLLSDIQAAAVDQKHSLSDMLRKCQVLAFRLKHDAFKAWVAHELNGYPAGATLPSYRASIPCELKAQLSGPFGASVSNSPVPISLFPKSVREGLTRFDFYQGVATLESTVAQATAVGSSTIRSSFPVEIYANLTILQGFQTMAMWQEAPITLVVGLLDQVRSRALTFSLEIEEENPAAGERQEEQRTSEPPVPLSRTDTIFNTVILGAAGVAIGPDASVQVAVKPGDLGSLMRYLEAHSVAQEDRDELAEAIEADAVEGRPSDRPGTRVSEWLGRINIRLASSGARIGESAVGSLIATAVARFLGLV